MGDQQTEREREEQQDDEARRAEVRSSPSFGEGKGSDCSRWQKNIAQA